MSAFASDRWRATIYNAFHRVAVMWKVLAYGNSGSNFVPIAVDSSGNVQVDIVSGGSSGAQYTEGDPDATITGTAIMWEDAADTLRAVSVVKPLPVDVVSGATAGVQYTEGDPDATITGTAVMWEDASDTLRAVSASKPLPVGGAVTVSGTVTATAQPGVDIGDVTVNNTGGAAAVNVQDGGNSLTVDAVSLPLPSGAATSALQTQPGVDIGDVTVNNAAGAAAVNVQDGGNSITVDAASLPLPSGAATSALQTQPGVDIGDVTVNNASGAAAVNIQDGGNVITVDGTVTANQGTAGTAWEVVGDVAADAAVPANPLATGGRASAAAPTPVSTDGDSVYSWHLLNGSQVVNIAAAGALIPGDATNGLKVNVTTIPGVVAGAEKAEDGGHTTGQTGNFVLGVRNEAASGVQGALVAMTSTDQDYGALALNQYGCLRIETMRSVDQCFYSGVAKTMLTAFVNVTASGNTAVVNAPGASTKIVVVDTFIVNQGAAVVGVKFQSATTDKTPTIDLSADGGGGRAFLQFEGGSNETLNLNLSANGTVGVMVRYLTAAG